ncbi:hybrid sensor histidine kinase/response regulator [Microbulbifer flavimaris]|uniref:histidine kinase n=1 Tax=Microbulbifer flavimaris TaxID=1781068 RepID=A0ABX4I565_9GAMM|nr:MULTISPECIES: hybrid sensor histidine kinase/response regulator [Microbulbifer]KUJ84806.1 hybrid sensor histidine kinase/response regulator [Microbulbifer sp. ZGT114]PCO06903.1 hybrid sensor histidine kinase/response regulator [Microbulbifer flavimaris]
MPIFDRPELKVQKDRRVCRVTDTRIAKYSRRGMLLSLLAFAIAIAIGDLRIVAPRLALVLGIGLVLFTLLRGYYVFRFGALYATGPHRWRRRYFLASTIGAAWWGLILLCHVWLVGFAPVTHFLWLYTVIFCSSITSVFSPYYRFLGWFIGASLLPAATKAFLSGDVLGAVYGFLTFAFVWLTAYQGRRDSENYWDRISAMQDLQTRASNLAAARKHSEAAVELTNEFVANIGQEFRSQLSDSLGALALLEAEPLSERQREWVQLAKNAGSQQLKLVDNVGLFTRVARKDIRLRHGSFNLVKTIEKSFKFAARAAHRQRLEFNFQIDDNLPVMAIGDNRKTSQLIRNLVDSATAIAQVGELWGQVSFRPIAHGEGQLTISLVDDGRGEILPDESELFGAFSRLDTTQVTTGLGLSIAKGLAEAMGGYLQLHSSPDGNRYHAEIKLEMEPNQRVYLTPDRRLQDCEVLVLHQKGLFVAGLVQVLRSFGMEVACLKWLPDSPREEEGTVVRAIERRQLVLLAPAMGDETLLSDITSIFSGEGVEPEGCPLICLGGYGHKPDFTPLMQAVPGAMYLARPVTRKELHDALISRLFGGARKASRRIVSSSGVSPRQRNLLLIEESRQHQGVTEEMLQALGYRVDVAASVEGALERMPEGQYDMILVDCQQNTEHSAEIIESLRHWESEHTPEDRLPIVALTSTTEEQFEGRCLAAGMDDFLTKPLAKDPLRETLERWLGDE